MVRQLAMIGAFVLACCGALAQSRAEDPVVRAWAYEQLIDGADLVIIGVPVSTTEVSRPDRPNRAVIDFETAVEVRFVLKGDADSDAVRISHRGLIPYRAGRFAVAATDSGRYLRLETKHDWVPPAERADKAESGRKDPEYLFFLKKLAGDLYEPVSGPSEPHLAVRRLGPVPMTDP